MLAGIDYGSKEAGTTAICIKINDHLEILQSKKNQDADQFIQKFLSEVSFKGAVFIDAPLSLPGVYQNKNHYQDFFYRECDRQTGAMSPMFLGGLTARAMKLKAGLAGKGIKCYESYPGGLARQLGLNKKGYKKDLSIIHTLTQFISKKSNIDNDPLLANWHQFDAFLCYVTGVRFLKEQCTTYGDPEEGLIYI